MPHAPKVYWGLRNSMNSQPHIHRGKHSLYIRQIFKMTEEWRLLDRTREALFWLTYLYKHTDSSVMCN